MKFKPYAKMMLMTVMRAMQERDSEFINSPQLDRWLDAMGFENYGRPSCRLPEMFRDMYKDKPLVDFLVKMYEEDIYEI